MTGKTPLRILAAAAASAIGTAPAAAVSISASIQQGVVADPCPPDKPLPDAIVAYMRSVVDPSRPAVSKPIASFEAMAAQTEVARRTDWAERCRYFHRDQWLASRPAGERREVFIGDSLTEIWGLADPAFFANGRVNRGISSQTTGQMLLRFDSDVLSLKPSVVHIWGGINDIAGNNGPETIAEIEGNIAAMATLARAAGIRVVIGAITPAKAFPWKPGIAPSSAITALNAWLAEYASQTGAQFVDYYRLLAGPGGALPKSLTFDGVHLTLAGYRRIEAASVAASAAAQ